LLRRLDLFLGLAINKAFGGHTDPDNQDYLGTFIDRKLKVDSLTINPVVAYRIAPGLSIGVGVQIERLAGTIDNPINEFKGEDWAVGFTAGILVEPARGTSIGLGWRSRMTHTLGGDLKTNNPFAALSASVPAETDLKLPDIVTLSLRQAVAPNVRVLGTIEWSSWSRLKELAFSSTAAGTIVSPIGVVPVPGGIALAAVPLNWDDGWLFAVGAEYDRSPHLTLRAGIAYEISPISSPEKRIAGNVEADRIWLSVGGTYHLSRTTSLHFAYSHNFIEDSSFDRISVGTGIPVQGTAEGSSDIVAVALSTRW
jgi:long-chain fatty acid transport protein